MQVNMDDRDSGIEQVDELKVVIEGYLAQVGMSQIQAHSHMGHIC